MLMRQRGEVPCEHLEWDSRHFGLRIARVRATTLADDAPAIIDWRRQEAIDCLYFLTPLARLEAIRMAENLGFRFIDLRITLEHASSGAEELMPLATRPFREHDLPQLIHLARTLHEDSRFFVDTGFPESASRALFEAWMTRACSDPSYQVLVADVDGRPAGYVACQRQDAGDGQIQLIGVDTAARRRGVGARLVDDAIGYFARHGVTRVRVVTQGRNLAALRLYESRGFLTVAQDAWYHWWANDPVSVGAASPR